MVRFDLFALSNGQGYVVDVQSDHASVSLRSRVVILVDTLGLPIKDLNTAVRIDGRDYAFAAQSLATLTTSEMGERIGSLMAEHGDRFAYALDILLTGF